MKNWLISLLVTLVLMGASLCMARVTASPGVSDQPDGWWCETREGTCAAYKFACEDPSCHWRLHAWVSTYHEGQAYQAFETEVLCQRARRRFDIPSTTCRRTRASQLGE